MHSGGQRRVVAGRGAKLAEGLAGLGQAEVEVEVEAEGESQSDIESEDEV